MPQHDVGVFNVIITCNPLLNSIAGFALIGEFSCRIQFVVAILGHPDGFVSKNGPSPVKAAWVHEHHLARQSMEFICHRLPRRSVDDVVVANFEHPGRLDI